MKEINGNTKVCGLIGNPVEHTLSPLIHNTLARKFGHNLVYVPFLVKEGNLQKAIAGASALQVKGLNITVPYKSEVIDLLDEIDELAEKIGAVNTLVSVENGFKGYNTDMTGLLRAMQSDGVFLKGESVVILGAGGAARAVAFLCAANDAKEIYIMNRTIEKAKQIAEEIKVYKPECIIKAMTLIEYDKLQGENFIAIQATSVGLYPKEDEAVIETEDFYKKIKAGYDLIYKPFETKFMKLLIKQNKNAYNGLKMLLYQGIIAYELWNEVKIPEEMAQEIYVLMRKELGIYE